MAAANLWFLLVIAFLCRAASEEHLVSRITFGSCSNQSAPQLFIWLGDNIYGDIRQPFKLFGKERTFGPWKNAPRFVPVTKEELQFRYNRAKSNPGYSRLRGRAQVIGTWDDHDYGLNDAGKEFRGKMRKQAGVYASYMFGPEGKQIKVFVRNMDIMLLQVILLDTRYHRDPLFSDGTILGDSQWKWLEKELSGPKSQLTIIASSIQVVSNSSATTGPMFHVESWGHFPKERNHLFKLIADSKRDGVVFISGDVHYGEIARYDCGIGYSLYDITSSGLTQAVEKAVLPPLWFIVRVGAWLTPTTMRVFNQKCQYRSCAYGQPNFGTIEIDWDAYPVAVKVGVRDVNGDPATSVDILLSELRASSANSKPTMKLREIRHYCTLEIDLPWFIRYRLAILFYNAVLVLLLVLLLLINAAISMGGKYLGKFKLD